jgi:hypothetical protein
MGLKYIKSREQYLFEQDFGMGGGLGQTTGEQQPVEEKPIKFLFLDKNLEFNSKKYPDGTAQGEYPVYSVMSKELESWLKSNIITSDKLTDAVAKLRRNNILDIVSGKKVNISNDDLPFIEKLKNAVSTNIFAKKEPDLTVIFTTDGIPSTEDVNITFIPIPNKK